MSCDRRKVILHLLPYHAFFTTHGDRAVNGSKCNGCNFQPTSPRGTNCAVMWLSKSQTSPSDLERCSVAFMAIINSFCMAQSLNDWRGKMRKEGSLPYKDCVCFIPCLEQFSSVNMQNILGLSPAHAHTHKHTSHRTTHRTQLR